MFDEREKIRNPGRWRMRAKKGVEWFDNHLLGMFLLIIVRAASSVAGVLSLFDGSKVQAALLLGVLGLTEIVGLIGRKFRRRSRFQEACDRCQRFVDAVFSYLLQQVSDFRVTILLTYRDKDTKLYLRPIFRNTECPIDGKSRRLLIDDTGGLHLGVAGEAWKTGNLSRSAPRVNGVVDPRSEAYMKAMRVDLPFVNSGTRNSTYVLAGVLNYRGRKVGVLTVDTKDAFNILGNEHRLEEPAKTQVQKIDAANLQMMEKVIFLTIRYLSERVLPDLFTEAA